MVLCHLTEGEKTVSELQPLIGISQSLLSHQLARLRRDKLVAARREKQRIFYLLARDQVNLVLQNIVVVMLGVYNIVEFLLH